MSRSLFDPNNSNKNKNKTSKVSHYAQEIKAIKKDLSKNNQSFYVKEVESYSDTNKREETEYQPEHETDIPEFVDPPQILKLLINSIFPKYFFLKIVFHKNCSMPKNNPSSKNSSCFNFSVKELLFKLPVITFWGIAIMVYLSEFETQNSLPSIEAIVSNPKTRHLALEQMEMFEEKDWELNYLSNIRKNLQDLALVSNTELDDVGEEEEEEEEENQLVEKNLDSETKIDPETADPEVQKLTDLERTAKILAEVFSDKEETETKTDSKPNPYLSKVKIKTSTQKPEIPKNSEIPNNQDISEERTKLDKLIDRKIQKLESKEFNDPFNPAFATEATPQMKHCPFEQGSEYQTTFRHVEPFLNSIRRDHYLVNLSPFGPNNQLRGFRDTLILAIYLNRTIVIPSFFKHRTDPSYHTGSTYQDGQQKIDGLELAKFMPTITMKEFGEKCGSLHPQSTKQDVDNLESGLDVVYLARISSNSSQFSRVQTYEKIWGFPVLNRNRKTNKAAMLPPTVINPKFYQKKTREEVYIYPSISQATSAFGPTAPNSNDGSCAMWQEVYRNMLLLSTLGKWAGRKINKSSDAEFRIENDKSLSSDIEKLKIPEEIIAKAILATPRIKPVRTAAYEFRQSMSAMTGNKTYVALHWRYDPNDFGKHCHGNTHGICGAMQDGIPTLVGKNIARFVQKLVEKNTNDKSPESSMPDHLKTMLMHKIIYIAAPTNQWPKMEEMKKSLKKSDIDVVYGRDLDNFLRKRYSKCPEDTLHDELHDFLSLTEMELCSTSTVFIYSGGSSWSRNINMERQAKRMHRWDQPNSWFLPASPKG